MRRRRRSGAAHFHPFGGDDPFLGREVDFAPAAFLVFVPFESYGFKGVAGIDIRLAFLGLFISGGVNPLIYIKPAVFCGFQRQSRTYVNVDK